MNVNFQYSKTLAGEGSILILLGIVPYVGWLLAIIGIVLFLRGVKELSNYYQDENIYRSALTGIKYYIVALVAAAVAIAAIVIGVGSATGFTFKSTLVLTGGFAAGITAFLAGLIIAFIFNVLAASELRKTFKMLARQSGEASFATAGTLLWIGAFLTLIGIGLLLIFVAWIFVTIGFFTMKPRELQQYNPQNAYAQPPPPSSVMIQGKNMKINQIIAQGGV